MTGLSDFELERYSRQLIVKGWSAKAQQALRLRPILVSKSLPLTFLYLEAAGAEPHFLTVPPSGTEGRPLLILEPSQSDVRIEDLPRIICQRDGSVFDESSGSVFQSSPLEVENPGVPIPSSAQICAALLTILKVMNDSQVHSPSREE